MLTLEELTLYFFIACGIACGCIIFIIVWLTYIQIKLKNLKPDKSNQLSRQTNMMADFCYTNPTIVKGEELDRRGFSMYSGSNYFDDDFAPKIKDQYGTCSEARSKF